MRGARSFEIVKELVAHVSNTLRRGEMGANFCNELSYIASGARGADFGSCFVLNGLGVEKKFGRPVTGKNETLRGETVLVRYDTSNGYSRDGAVGSGYACGVGCVCSAWCEVETDGALEVRRSDVRTRV